MNHGRFVIDTVEKDGIIQHSLLGNFDCTVAIKFVGDHLIEWGEKPVMWDFSSCSLAEVQVQEWKAVLPALRSSAEVRRGIRAALVSDSAFQFGMLRMMEIVGKIHDYPIELSCFRDRDSAAQWLLSSVDSVKP